MLVCFRSWILHFSLKRISAGIYTKLFWEFPWLSRFSTIILIWSHYPCDKPLEYYFCSLVIKCFDSLLYIINNLWKCDSPSRHCSPPKEMEVLSLTWFQFSGLFCIVQPRFQKFFKMRRAAALARVRALTRAFTIPLRLTHAGSAIWKQAVSFNPLISVINQLWLWSKGVLRWGSAEPHMEPKLFCRAVVALPRGNKQATIQFVEISCLFSRGSSL